MILIDGHLDLAFNALNQGRELTLELDALRQREKRQHEEAMVTFPELPRAGVGIAFATLFVMPHLDEGSPQPKRTYTTPQEARALAVEQLERYERWEETGWVRILRRRADLDAQLNALGKGATPLGIVLLMEGADPLLEPADLDGWFAWGVRILGPAWKQTRYAGGTSAPGPLTALGVELVEAVKHHGVILDTSHLAEESFWQALELAPRHVIASHSNARAFVNTDRHLSDAMIQALGDRGGLVGLVLASSFLKAGVTRGDPRSAVTLTEVQHQAEHIAGLIGWDKLAVGSDFDGGFGRQETPLEIDRAADLRKLGEIVPRFAREGLLGGNWLALLQRALPS